MKTKVSARVLALLAVLVLLVSSLGLAVSADDANAKVREAKNGVVLVVYCYPDPNHTEKWVVASCGTGFFVNENQIVTCYHVLHDEDWIDYLALEFPDYKSKMEIRVYYDGGQYFTAEEKIGTFNSEIDLTVIEFKSGQQPKAKTILPLLSDDDLLQDITPVYALGFSYTDIEDKNGTNAWKADDVNAENGNFNKRTIITSRPELGEVLNHNCSLTSGMSGGPLINVNGVVVGINFAINIENTNVNYAIPVGRLANMLDTASIEFTSCGLDGTASVSSDVEVEDVETPEVEDVESSVVASEVNVVTAALDAALAKANAIDEDSYKGDFDALDEAIAAANTARDSGDQTAVDAAAEALNDAIDAMEEKGGMSVKLIAIIAGAAVVVIIIAIVIVIVVKKNKDSDFDDDVPTQPAPPAPNGNGFTPAGGFTPSAPAPAKGFSAPAPVDMPTSVLAGDSAATTVLSAGSSETTVLSGKPYARLVRKSNGETVTVNANTFVIGRERRKANYCIADNGSVGRAHAQIVKNGDKVAIVDLNSVNGTFVNGVKCAPNAAVTLNSGDKITLSDEDFTVTIL